MVNPVIDKETQGKMRQYALAKGKDVEKWLGNLYLSAMNKELWELKLRVCNLITMKMAQAALCNNILIYRNHGVSDRDMRNIENKPQKFELLINKIFQSQSKEELLTLTTELVDQIRQFFRSLDNSDNSTSSHKPPDDDDQTSFIKLIGKLDRVLSEYYKPDKIGFFYSFLQCVDLIQKFHNQGALTETLYESVLTEKMSFDEPFVEALKSLKKSSIGSY